jgi:lysophospholipase L1-like esterase
MPGGYPGIDAFGFRNPAVPVQADVVALGDSHTYGYNVPEDQSWPTQLSGYSGLSVYNMGMGGYGPLQYLALTPRALALHPKHLVVAVLLVNDLADVCLLVRRRPFWKTLGERNGFDLSYCSANPSKSERTWVRVTPHRGVLLDWLAGTQPASVMRRFYRRHFPGPPPACVVVDGVNDTMISIAHMQAQTDQLDLANLEISRSLEITEKVLARIERDARRSGARMTVLLVPSKALVYESARRRFRGGACPHYETAIANEKAVRDRLRAFLDQTGLVWTDPLPTLQRALDEQANVYPHDDDGHPLAEGYRAYALSVFEATRSDR